MPEDVLAVAGHCCSVRLTRLPELEEGIDFTPGDAARADFEGLYRPVKASAAVQHGVSPAEEANATPETPSGTHT